MADCDSSARFFSGARIRVAAKLPLLAAEIEGAVIEPRVVRWREMLENGTRDHHGDRCRREDQRVFRGRVLRLTLLALANADIR